MIIVTNPIISQLKYLDMINVSKIKVLVEISYFFLNILIICDKILHVTKNHIKNNSIIIFLVMELQDEKGSPLLMNTPDIS